jgi:hypothetical protein
MDYRGFINGAYMLLNMYNLEEALPQIVKSQLQKFAELTLICELNSKPTGRENIIGQGAVVLRVFNDICDVSFDEGMVQELMIEIEDQQADYKYNWLEEDTADYYDEVLTAVLETESPVAR